MSTKQKSDVENRVEEYLKAFPLGRTVRQIENEFGDVDSDEIQDALTSLCEDGVVLQISNEYRWTG